MKLQVLRFFTLTLSIAAFGLVGCGGGGSDASGAPTALSVTPDSIKFDYSPATACIGSTLPTTVLINGGAGDYKVNSTSPQEITLSNVVKVNGVYQFSFILNSLVCHSGDGIAIQVVDTKKNIAVVKVSSAASGTSS